MDLVRQTPFAVEHVLQLDAQSGLETLFVVVKGTFDVREGRAVPSDVQLPVRLADEYRGEPGLSSLLGAGDLAPFKPAADVLLEGFAYTQASSRHQALVALRVGALQKGLRVTGDRIWDKTLGVSSMSDPKPFLKLELCYERAFGGSDLSVPDQGARCEENPVGMGFRAKGSKLPVAGSPVPNLESPMAQQRSVGETVPAVGLGPVAPDWLPRRRFTGTLDERWQELRCPLLPDDFDTRFHQVAPADQILAGYVKGGEEVRVVGATPEKSWDFSLPTMAPEVVVKVGQARESLAAPCDTLVLMPETQQLTLTWRARYPVQGRVHQLHWIKVQERV